MTEWKTCKHCEGGGICRGSICEHLRAEAEAKLAMERKEREGLYPVIDQIKAVRAVLERELKEMTENRDAWMRTAEKMHASIMELETKASALGGQ